MAKLRCATWSGRTPPRGVGARVPLRVSWSGRAPHAVSATRLAAAVNIILFHYRISGADFGQPRARQRSSLARADLARFENSRGVVLTEYSSTKQRPYRRFSGPDIAFLRTLSCADAGGLETIRPIVRHAFTEKRAARCFSPGRATELGGAAIEGRTHSLGAASRRTRTAPHVFVEADLSYTVPRRRESISLRLRDRVPRPWSPFQSTGRTYPAVRH